MATMWHEQRIEAALRRATPALREQFDAVVGALRPIWAPDPRNRPQCMAYRLCKTVDVVGYGGGAGSGKTDLAIGLSLTEHEVAAIFRREGTELTAIVDRVTSLVGNRDGYNGQERIWREPVPGVQLEFGSVPNLGDERKYQGRPKSALIIDEAANFLEQQVRFLMGWVRSVNPDQHCVTLMTMNPPTSSDGLWVIDYFAPWLDPMHPCPAASGEVRWFAVIGDKETEVVDGSHFMHNGELVKPQSRTFVHARVTDNPYLYGTNYMAQLQALPEPLRSQMLHGDFAAGMQDDPWQAIPTAWVDAAMARWKKRDVKTRMDSIGVDVARGGKDNTIIARRHQHWYDELLAYPGTQTPDGPTVAGLVIACMRDRAPIHIDVIGVGASPYDFLRSARQQIMGVNVAEKSTATDRSGRLSFSNQRSQLIWQFRESLDPASNLAVELPPDNRLRADLCAYKWRLRGAIIEIESREEVIKRIGRSPDYASAVILAMMNTPRMSDLTTDAAAAASTQRGHDPMVVLTAQDYDPMKGLR